MAPSNSDPAAIEAEVARIGWMNKAELKALWQTLMKGEPPPAFGPDLLRRSLAFKVQENAFGGNSAQVRRELAALIKQISARPSAKIELPRRIKSGAVLIREWKGKVVRVTVVDNGFLYEGTTYASLSEVANLITGTNWNGPRFFGLRPTKNQSREAEVTARQKPARGRGRPRRSGKSRSDNHRGIAT